MNLPKTCSNDSFDLNFHSTLIFPHTYSLPYFNPSITPKNVIISPDLHESITSPYFLSPGSSKVMTLSFSVSDTNDNGNIRVFFNFNLISNREMLMKLFMLFVIM